MNRTGVLSLCFYMNRPEGHIKKKVHRPLNKKGTRNSEEKVYQKGLVFIFWEAVVPKDRPQVRPGQNG